MTQNYSFECWFRVRLWFLVENPKVCITTGPSTNSESQVFKNIQAFNCIKHFRKSEFEYMHDLSIQIQGERFIKLTYLLYKIYKNNFQTWFVFFMDHNLISVTNILDGSKILCYDYFLFYSKNNIMFKITTIFGSNHNN